MFVKFRMKNEPKLKYFENKNSQIMIWFIMKNNYAYEDIFLVCIDKLRGQYLKFPISQY